jgi:hypothetical protein
MEKQKNNGDQVEKLSKFIDFEDEYAWDSDKEKKFVNMLTVPTNFSEETGRLLLNNVYKIFYVITIFSVALVTKTIFISQENTSMNFLNVTISVNPNWIIIIIALCIFIIPIIIYFIFFCKMMKRVLQEK